jgi:putative Holliday junction resolvase
VVLWDESFSTYDARATREALGFPRKKRRGHMDELAAAIILQTYLDALTSNDPGDDRPWSTEDLT